MVIRRTQSANKIVASYERAKRSDPSITQAEFMRTAYHESGQKPPKDPGRYLRKLIAGERSGNVIYEKSKPKKGSTGQFQIEFTDREGKRIASQNVTSFGGSGSTFDIPAIEAELHGKHAGHLDTTVAAFRRKYASSAGEFDPQRFRVRQITFHRRKAFQLVFRTAP